MGNVAGAPGGGKLTAGSISDHRDRIRIEMIEVSSAMVTCTVAW
jgi:hypothetical protein